MGKKRNDDPDMFVVCFADIYYRPKALHAPERMYAPSHSVMELAARKWLPGVQGGGVKKGWFVEQIVSPGGSLPFDSRAL